MLYLSMSSGRIYVIYDVVEMYPGGYEVCVRVYNCLSQKLLSREIKWFKGSLPLVKPNGERTTLQEVYNETRLLAKASNQKPCA